MSAVPPEMGNREEEVYFVGRHASVKFVCPCEFSNHAQSMIGEWESIAMTDSPATRPIFNDDASQRKTGFTLVELLVVIGIIGIIIALLLPAHRSARPAARRAQCTNNLKQIAIALQSYESAYHALPPAYTVDASGQRLHSWRTLILPYLEQKPLYDTIDLSKAWDDPANAEASKASVPAYRCPSADGPPNHTAYLAIVASNGALLPAKPRALSEITDNHGETLLVIEVDFPHAVPWMAPTDADETLLLSLGAKSQLAHPAGMNAAFVDGHVHFLQVDVPAAQRRALISIAGNDK